MPIYVYCCRACGVRFEELVRAAAQAPPCEACGSSDVERVLSSFSTRWKPSRVNWHRLGL